MKKLKKLPLFLLVAALMVACLVVPAGAAASPSTETEVNGITMTKFVTGPDAGGNYTITLGATTESNKVNVKSAANIVLVLDASQTMAGDNAAALESAVNGFLFSMIDSPESKVAIVSYANDATNHTVGLVPITVDGGQTVNSVLTNANETVKTYANATISNTIKGKQADAGLEMAVDILQAYQTANPTDTTPCTVILFTNGIPTDDVTADSVWQTDAYGIAQDALHWSTILKGQKGATVLSDAHRNQQFYTSDFLGVSGASKTDQTTWNRMIEKNIGCGAKVYCVGVGLPSYTFELFGSDGAKINEFLFRASSNVPDSSHENSGFSSYRYDDTTRRAYYLVSSDMSGLSGVFNSIETETGIALDSITVKDTIPAYMEVVDTKGGSSTPNADGSTTVSWLDSLSPSDPVSQTLVVKFKDGFLGGNEVPTNLENSGIYTTVNGVETPVAAFGVPTVDVPVPTMLTVAGTPKNIYLGSTLTPTDLAALTAGAMLNINGVEVACTNLAEWQTKFVTVGLTASVSDVLDGTTYGLTLSVTPIGGTTQEFTGTGALNIFKPELSTPDYTVYLGGTDPEIKTTTTWKDANGTLDTAVTMIGTAPTVTPAYSQSKAFTGCTPVTVTATIGGQNVTEDTHYTANDFTVHVHTPVIKGTDKTIYLGDSTTFAASVTDTWTACGCSGAPAVSGNKPTSATFTYDLTNTTISPNQCTDYTATLATIGGLNVGALTFDGKSDGFTVHVLYPTVAIDKENVVYYGETAVLSPVVTWSCTGNHSDIPAAQGSAPVGVSNCSFNYNMQLTGCKGDVTASVTWGNGEYTYNSNTATVHVLKPTITPQDKTIYVTQSQDLDACMNVGETWHCGCVSVLGLGNQQSGSSPTYAPVFDFGGVSATGNVVSPTECTTYTATATINGVVFPLTSKNNQATVHVVKPVITNADTTIYLGNSTDLNSLMTEGANWVCDTTCSATQSRPVMSDKTRVAPALDHSFVADSVTVAANDEGVYAPVTCTPVTVTTKVGTYPVTPKENDSTFTVHVLVPAFTVTTQDLWADLGTEVDLYNDGTEVYDAVKSCEQSWVYSGSCAEADHGDHPDGAPTVAVTNVLFGDDATKTITEADITVTVTGVAYSINNGKTGTAAGTNLVVNGEEADTATLHANTFVLKISNTTGQNGIFDLKLGENTLNQLAVPSGSSTTDVYELYCGKTYSLAEENGWSWRYDNVAGVTGTITHSTTGVALRNCGAEVPVTISYGDQTKTKWLSGQDHAINNKNGRVDEIPAPTSLFSFVKRKEDAE